MNFLSPESVIRLGSFAGVLGVMTVWELLAPRVRAMTCSGTRAAELALRMKYAGVPGERLQVVEDLTAGLDAALAEGQGPLYALPTYTALLELRELLARRGQARESWR